MVRKLVITQSLDKKLVEEIRTIIPDWNIIIGKEPKVWVDHLKEAEIIAGWKNEIAEKCLNSNSKLAWIQSWSAGINSFPLEKMESQGIKLTSANGVHAFPISETIFALMLGLTRNIHTYVRNQVTNTWHHGGIKLEIHNKTIGIIGVGAIGKETAKLAKAFGMKVLGVRNSGKPEEYVDEMFNQDQLHSVLPQCDYVVVTLPLTEKTAKMFGSDQFKLMKPSAFFINIGRGEIVKEDELIIALKNNQLAGAGLDVFTTEPLPENSPLWEMENVIITPHTSGSTEYYNQRVIRDIFIPNLKNHLRGEPQSVNLVDYAKGY